MLVLALWSLGLLSLFAVNIAVNVRQKILLASRLEQRSNVRLIARSGIKRAISVLLNDLRENEFRYGIGSKQVRHDDKSKFHDVKVGPGSFDVSYQFEDKSISFSQTQYGLVDEDGKLNLNTAEPEELLKLIYLAVNQNPEVAQTLSQAIYDWRMPGTSQLTGFYSDDYYHKLKFPYLPKDGPFEVLEELMLVQGITQEVFDKMRPYVTIYGDGKVNVNTAPREALVAIGLSGALVDKILFVRRGPDGHDSTFDDFIFREPFDLAINVNQIVKLESKEIKQIDRLNYRRKIKTNSSFYFMKSRGKLINSAGSHEVNCVFDAEEKRIVYWREK